jgi:hypothetical protein
VDKIIELEAGAGSGFKIFYTLVVSLAVLATLTANTSWVIKLTVLLTLVVFNWFLARQRRQQKNTRILRIHISGSVTLISDTGREYFGILEKGSWTSRWFSIVNVGLFDRWKTQHLLVCANRNSISKYRQLLKWMRCGVDMHARDVKLGQG